MKKFIPIAFFALMPMVGFSQNAPIDFETGGYGADWTWATFEAPAGKNNPTFSIASNPSADSKNNSSKVAKIVIEYATTASWGSAGCESKHGSDIGSFAVTSSNNLVKMMIYQEGFAAPVALKFANNSGGAHSQVTVNNTIADAWVEVEFDMSEWIGSGLGKPDQIIFFPSHAARNSGHTVYFDNVTFGNVKALAEPTAAAANPNYEAANVISLFADNLEDVTVNTWLTGWSSSSLKEVQIAGNDVKKYSGMDVVGIETVGANLIDISSMEDLNFDIWSPNSTKFKIKLVDFGADKGYQGGDDSDHELTFDAPAMEEWVNYHIALSDFTGLTGRENLAQIVLVSEPTGTSVIYLDNFFFSKGYPTSLTEKEAFSSFNVFPNPATDAINIELTARTGTILNYTVRSINGQVILNKEVNSKVLNQTLNTTNFGTGVYFLQVNTDQGAYTHKIIID